MKRCSEPVPRRPIRLLAVMASLVGGGAERQMVLLLRQLDRARFAPELCLLNAEGPFLDDLPPDVRVTNLRKRRPSDLFRLIVVLARLIRKGRYDAVLARVDYTNFVTTAAVWLSRTRVPTIIVEDSAQARELAGRRDRRAREALLRWTYRRASLIVVPSPGVAEEVKQCVPGLADIRVIPNMVDRTASPCGGRNDGARAQQSLVPVIIAVGRLTPAKGFDVLVAAFERVNRGRPCLLKIVGDGPEMAALRAQVQSANLANRVEFTGFLQDPFRAFPRIDVFVCSSLWESFGNVLIEAMALGLPVVSTDAPHGPRYLMRDGENGLVAKAGDAEDLARKVETLLDDPDLACRVGEGGQQFARAFAAERVTRIFQEAIAEVTGDQTSRQCAR